MDDGEIKRWSLDSEVIELQTSRTLMAHEQEINSISVSLDNQFVASASQVKRKFYAIFLPLQLNKYALRPEDAENIPLGFQVSDLCF